MDRRKIILDRAIIERPHLLNSFDPWNITSIFEHMGTDPEWRFFKTKESVLEHDCPIVLGGATLVGAFENKGYYNFSIWLDKFYKKHETMTLISTGELFHPRRLKILKEIDSYGKPCRIISPWRYGKFKNIKEYNHDLDTTILHVTEFAPSMDSDDNFFGLCRTTVKPDRPGRRELVENLQSVDQGFGDIRTDYTTVITAKDLESNAQSRERKCLNNQIPYDLYHRCQMEIVCETNSTVSEVFYPTEKIYKPLCGEMPFVVLSSKGFLKGLRQKGFRTFGEIFDESYDDIEDLSDRVNAIGKLVKSIKHKDLKSSCRHITRHNRKRFYEMYSMAHVIYTKKLRKIIKLIISEQ